MARDEDIAIAKDTMLFLEEEVSKTQLNNVRLGINNLIQKQVETMSIANATPQYLFKILSKPVAPELKSEPKRAFICILGFLFGLITSSLYVLINNYLYKKRAS